MSSRKMGTDAFGCLFGEEYSYYTDDPDNLFGKHAEGLVGRLIAVMNECEGRHTNTKVNLPFLPIKISTSNGDEGF